MYQKSHKKGGYYMANKEERLAEDFGLTTEAVEKMAQKRKSPFTYTLSVEQDGRLEAYAVSEIRRKAL